MHPLAPQIEIAVLEADILARTVILCHLKRQHIGGGLQLRAGDEDLDLSRRHLRVDRLGGAGAHVAVDGDDRFHAPFPDRFNQRRTLIDHALRQAKAVAQIDEQNPAMIAHAVDPSRKAYGLPGLAFAQFSAVMCSIGVHFHLIPCNIVPLRPERQYATHYR